MEQIFKEVVGRVSASKVHETNKERPKEEVGDESRLIFARIHVQASVFLHHCLWLKFLEVMHLNIFWVWVRGRIASGCILQYIGVERMWMGFVAPAKRMHPAMKE